MTKYWVWAETTDRLCHSGDSQSEASIVSRDQYQPIRGQYQPMKGPTLMVPVSSTRLSSENFYFSKLIIPVIYKHHKQRLHRSSSDMSRRILNGLLIIYYTNLNSSRLYIHVISKEWHCTDFQEQSFCWSPVQVFLSLKYFSNFQQLY